ncbi:MAG TPA: hypothetical protein VK421_18370 [Pyrinomonadaceae bacterium]|nr:hypothetical protein [Pyrinomonadaceae bacterium]
MSTAVEEVVEQVKALPPEEREKIRDALSQLITLFLAGAAITIMKKTASFTPDEMRQLQHSLNKMVWETADTDMRLNFVRSIRGKYANLPTSSEAFAARKTEEIALEDRRSRP